MDSGAPKEPAPPAFPLVKDAIDPEVASVKSLLKLLDKAAKSARTYGTGNPVAKRFFDQFYEDLSKHLDAHTQVAFLVQRSELYFKEHVVYQQDREATGDSIAFKMYADGIRELSFCEGLSRDDLAFFLEALWGNNDAGDTTQNDDDDIVTRLWARDLSTITLVTAEEIVRSSGYSMDALELHHAGLMDAPLSSLRDILDHERARLAAGAEPNRGEAASDGGSPGHSDAPGGARRPLQPNVVGYEVSQEESDALTTEIKEECGRDSTMYIIDILTAILASEQSASLLTKLFDVWGGVVEALIRDGQWTVLESVLAMLQDAEAVRPDLSPDHRRQVTALFDALGRPERIKLIENYLNKTPPQPRTEGLLTLLLSMKKEIVPALCSLLANLEYPAHQSIVVEALITVARDNADPVVRGLSDKRPVYVRNLLALIGKWNDPRLADPVEKALRHPDAHVRKDVLRVLANLRPSGQGAKLIALLNDPDETVRLTAMKLLSGGQYTAPFPCWSPFVATEGFHERAPSEKRAIFQAMRHTAGDEAVPFWQSLLTEWSWTNRKKKEELALMAVDALGKLASDPAIAALELGQKKGTAAVRQACGVALAAASRQQRAKTPPTANS